MANPDRVRILDGARRELLGLPSTPRQRIRLAIRRLALDPRPRGAKLLAGGTAERIWRLRVGDYRVLYEIGEKELVVLVIRVRHRRDAYRG